MFAVLTCLYRDHDYRLVALAAAVCLVSCWTCLSAHRRAQAASGELRLALIALTSVVAAAGVWSTHFLAMLAYQPGLNIRYDMVLTAASLMVAIGGFFIGFSIAAARPILANRLLGGAVVGASVSAMHFTGVAAMRLPAVLLWDKGLVAAALVMAAAIAAAALAAGGALNDRRKMLTGTGLLVLAIVSLHFTAMGAVTVLPDSTITLAQGALDRPGLALQVAIFVLLILGAAGALLGLDRYSSRSTLASLRAALDCAPTALAFFDSRERLMFWNEPYAQVTQTYGISPEVGFTFRHLLERSRARGLPPGPDDTPTSTGLRKRVTREFALPDGRWVRTEVAPTQDGGAVVVISDVSDQRRATAHRGLRP
jgi:NO-binding membrane sensor protein with MHYT domain